jgi:hypothetical protein
VAPAGAAAGVKSAIRARSGAEVAVAADSEIAVAVAVAVANFAGAEVGEVWRVEV